MTTAAVLRFVLRTPMLSELRLPHCRRVDAVALIRGVEILPSAASSLYLSSSSSLSVRERNEGVEAAAHSSGVGNLARNAYSVGEARPLSSSHPPNSASSDKSAPSSTASSLLKPRLRPPQRGDGSSLSQSKSASSLFHGSASSNRGGAGGGRRGKGGARGENSSCQLNSSNSSSYSRSGLDYDWTGPDETYMATNSSASAAANTPSVVTSEATAIAPAHSLGQGAAERLAPYLDLIDLRGCCGSPLHPALSSVPSSTVPVLSSRQEGGWLGISGFTEPMPGLLRRLRPSLRLPAV